MPIITIKIRRQMKKSESNHTFSRDDFFTVEELANFLRVKRSTVYSWTHRKLIPYFKHGNRIYFLKKHVEAFVFNENNFHKSMTQLSAEAFRERLSAGK